VLNVNGNGETATVRSRPLVWTGGGVLSPGPAVDETVSWSANGHSLLPGLSPGDLVSLHWDWICDVITDEQRDRIEALEASRRAAVFPASAPVR
jgi:hypothetical protein